MKPKVKKNQKEKEWREIKTTIKINERGLERVLKTIDKESEYVHGLQVSTPPPSKECWMCRSLLDHKDCPNKPQDTCCCDVRGELYCARCWKGRHQDCIDCCNEHSLALVNGYVCKCPHCSKPSVSDREEEVSYNVAVCDKCKSPYVTEGHGCTPEPDKRGDCSCEESQEAWQTCKAHGIEISEDKGGEDGGWIQVFVRAGGEDYQLWTNEPFYINGAEYKSIISSATLKARRELLEEFFEEIVEEPFFKEGIDDLTDYRIEIGKAYRKLAKLLS